jgi:hypothetical protein
VHEASPYSYAVVLMKSLHKFLLLCLTDSNESGQSQVRLKGVVGNNMKPSDLAKQTSPGRLIAPGPLSDLSLAQDNGVQLVAVHDSELAKS